MNPIARNPKFFTSVLLLMWAFCASPLYGQGPGRAAFTEAENLRRQGQFRQAIDQYDNAIRLEPSNFQYYFQKGKCEYQMKDIDAAKASFKRTVEFRHNFTPAYSLLAKIYKDENDIQNAVFYYEEAAKYESDTQRKVQYKLLLINLLLKEGRTSEAKRHITEARAADPSNPSLLYYEAESFLLESNWEMAKQNLEKALSSERLAGANPAELAKYYYSLGLAYFNMGDVATAKRVWAKANFGPYAELIAQQLQQSDYAHFYKVAVSYYLNGEYAKADQYVNKAMEIQKVFPAGNLLKGRIAAQSGNTSAAIKYYEDAANQEKEPEKRAKPYFYMATLQYNQRDYAGAVNSLRQAMQMSKQPSASMVSLYAKSLYGAGQYQECMNQLDALIRNTTDQNAKARYQFMLGMCAVRMGDKVKATEAFKAAMYGSVKPAAKEELDRLTKG